jgi:CheY-like chemotaxis protein
MVGSVFVVEDIPEMSELMKTYLELEGLFVMEALNADAAEVIPGSRAYSSRQRLRTPGRGQDRALWSL